MRDGILRMCNQWRNRKEIQGVVADTSMERLFVCERTCIS